jgi:hypothetical protein
MAHECSCRHDSPMALVLLAALNEPRETPA